MARGIRKVCREIQDSLSNGSAELQPLDHRLIPLACRAVIAFLRERYVPEGSYHDPFARFEVYQAADFANPMESGVSLFLHRVRQDRALELHFILTAWAKTAERQHALAGWMMEQLERIPTLPQGLLEEVSPDVITPLGVTVSISPSKEDIHQIWKAVSDAPFQVSVPYVTRIKRVERE